MKCHARRLSAAVTQAPCNHVITAAVSAAVTQQSAVSSLLTANVALQETGMMSLILAPFCRILSFFFFSFYLVEIASYTGSIKDQLFKSDHPKLCFLCERVPKPERKKKNNERMNEKIWLDRLTHYRLIK